MLQDIIAYLKTQPNYTVKWNDDPYETFAAEWQDWSFAKPNYSQLFIGYWYEENGDLVPDPNITIEFEGEKIVSMTLANMFGPRRLKDEADIEYALDLVKLCWERHFIQRIQIAVK